MTRNRPIVVVFICTVLFLLVITVVPVFVESSPLHAQGAPVAETPTGVPTQPEPTDTPVPTATNTPEPTATNTLEPTETPLEPPQTVTPPPTPVPPSQIPEPITVILFGTGLAALSAYAARRKKQE
jgi:hypothetical protein